MLVPPLGGITTPVVDLSAATPVVICLTISS